MVSTNDQDRANASHDATRLPIFDVGEVPPFDDELFARTAETVAGKIDPVGEPNATPQDLASAWAKITEAGWPGLLVPEEVGGGGFALSFAAVAAQALGGRGLVTPFFETAVVAPLLLRQVSGERREQLLERILAGDVLVPIVGVDEDMTFRTVPSLSARPAGGCAVRISGEARVPFGEVASAFLVALDVDGTGMLASVERDDAVVRAAGDADDPDLAFVDFADTVLPADRLMPVGSWPLAGVDIAVALVDAYLVGAMSYVTELTTSFVDERHQFSRPLSAFQAVRHHCADMYTSVTRSRLLCRQSLTQVASGAAGPLPLFTHAATCEAALRTAELAHQLHGGVGYYRPYPLERISRGVYRATRSLCSSEAVRDYCVRELARMEDPLHSLLGSLTNPAHSTIG